MKKYKQSDHIIYHGDAEMVLAEEVADSSVDLIFANPPYNIGKRFMNFRDRWPSDRIYAEWCFRWLEICIDKLSPSGSMYLMASTQAMPYIDLFIRDRLTVMGRIVWCYDSSGVQAKNHFGSMYEPILYCVKDRKNYIFNSSDISVEAKTGATRKLIDYRKSVPSVYNSKKVPGNVWMYNRVRYRMEEYEEHPSQKPEMLLERIILASSNPASTVLDPFAGTFTTCAVAKSLGRKTIGIEKEETYINIGLRRVLGYKEHNGSPLSKPIKNTRRRCPDDIRRGRNDRRASHA